MFADLIHAALSHAALTFLKLKWQLNLRQLSPSTFPQCRTAACTVEVYFKATPVCVRPAYQLLIRYCRYCTATVDTVGLLWGTAAHAPHTSLTDK